MDKPIPVNEANERKALIHELMEVVSKEAKAVFVGAAEDLAQQYYGTREGKTLQIAVEDAEGTDLEWLQERLTDKASEEIDRLRVFVEGLIEERDEARALRAASDRVLASGVVVSAEQYAELVRAAGPNVSFLDELRLANERAEVAQRERDEARAGAERLRSDVASLEAGIKAQDEVLTARYNQQLARAQTAYRRGAETMREAAGVTAFTALFSPDPSRVRLLETVVSAIRALPIPVPPQGENQ